MSMSTTETKVNNIPKLRFSGFNDVWQDTTLGKVGTTVNGLTYSPDDVNDNGVLVLRSSNVQGRRLKFDDNVFVNVQDGQYNPVVENDILICVRNGSRNLIGKNTLITKKAEGMAFGAFMSIYRSDSNRFLFQWFDTDMYKKQVHQNLGATINSINGSDLRKFKLITPSSADEQNKIADFLGSVDALLDNLRQQKTEMETYKRGMMQRLFTQQVRFKDESGNAYPKWQEKKLSQLGKFVSGVGFTESEQGGKEGVPFYKVSDFNLAGNEIVMSTANNFVTKEQITQNKYKVVKEKALIFAKVGAAIYMERKRIAQNFLLDNNMMAFVTDVNISFIYYLSQSVRFSKYAQVGALPSCNASDIGDIKVALPVSTQEQQKIADFLTSIDQAITVKSQKIVKVEQWKKGLMQKMFV